MVLLFVRDSHIFGNVARAASRQRPSRHDLAALFIPEEIRMIVNWGDIYEVIYMNTSRTVVADAFRRAAGLPNRPAGKGRTRDHSAKDRRYRGARECMKQRHGVRP